MVYIPEKRESPWHAGSRASRPTEGGHGRPEGTGYRTVPWSACTTRPHGPSGTGRPTPIGVSRAGERRTSTGEFLAGIPGGNLFPKGLYRITKRDYEKTPI